MAPVWCTLTLPCLCSVDSETAPPDGSGTVQRLLQTRADQWRAVDGVWRSPTGARTWDKVTTTSCKITKIHKRTIIYANTSWRTVNFFTVSIIRFEVMLCITLIMLLPNCCTYFYSAINLAIFLCIVYLFSGHYPAIICQLPTKLCNSPLYIYLYHCVCYFWKWILIQSFHNDTSAMHNRVCRVCFNRGISRVYWSKWGPVRWCFVESPISRGSGGIWNPSRCPP